jgi:hypothetical protein
MNIQAGPYTGLDCSHTNCQKEAFMFVLYGKAQRLFDPSSLLLLYLGTKLNFIFQTFLFGAFRKITDAEVLFKLIICLFNYFFFF